MKKDFGFTLIELMITLAVLAILIGLAAPSMSDLIRNNRVAAATTAFSAAVSHARSEAIKRGQTVVFCASSNPNDAAPSCASAGGWQVGWVAFIDADGDNDFTAGETVLKVWQDPGPGSSITSTNLFISFNPRGMPSSNDTFNICIAPNQRELKLNATGRMHITSAGSCT